MRTTGAPLKWVTFSLSMRGQTSAGSNLRRQTCVPPRAVTAQVKQLSHTSTLYPTLPIVELAEKLANLTPGDLEKCFFTASGTEADETAVMMAQIFTGNFELIALRHGYSGRSLLAQSLTAHAAWRAMPTQAPAIKHALAPYCYRCP